MSGIAGVLYVDGRPASADDVSPLLRCLEHRGPDGPATAALDSVAMGLARMITTPEATTEVQPAADAAAGLLATFDGRLDAREDLAAALGMAASGASDVDLLLAAYRRWGMACPGHLIGDFAFAVWDSPHRRLFAARDTMGVRPFCYRRLTDRFQWASEPQALVRQATAEPNERYVADLLHGIVSSDVETLYREVLRLPAAHALSVSSEGLLQTWRYWQPDAAREIRYRDPSDYHAHFRELLATAIRAQLRLSGGATLGLSSGIDSSVIAAQVALLRDGGDARAAGVAARTVAYPREPENEAPLASETAERLRLPWSSYPAVFPEAQHYAADAAVTLDLPEPPNSATASAFRQASSASARVLFTGVGGDEWFTGSDGLLPSLIRSGRLLSAARKLVEDRRAPGATPVGRVLWMAAWTATPPPVKQGVRSILGRPRLPDWIEPAFARRTGLIDRLHHPSPDVLFHDPATTRLFQDATWSETGWRREQNERVAAYQGLEERYPLCDRRLIEFACAIPDEVRKRAGVSKWLMRRAYSDVLPGWLGQAQSRIDFGWVLLDGLERVGGLSGLLASEPVGRGWLRAGVVERMYGELRAGVWRHGLVLWQAMAVHFWLTALSRRR